MLAIKFHRIGKKRQPSFRIIVQEKREKVGGRNAEDIGWYSPLTKKFEIAAERARHWIQKGAQPTDSVWNLLLKAGVIQGAKRPAHATKPKAAAVAAEAPKEAAPAAAPAEGAAVPAAGEGAASEAK